MTNAYQQINTKVQPGLNLLNLIIVAVIIIPISPGVS
jgi:hypothetical protein